MSFGNSEKYKGEQTQYGEKQINALYNPFTFTNCAPKWPDGLANYSIGRKQQFSSEVYGADILICLFPGAGNWCQAWFWDEAANDAMMLANHGDTRTFKFTRDKYDTINVPAIDPARNATLLPEGFRTKQQRFDKWRGVSYALHINCCNNDEDNDGWFECIRTSRNSFRHRFGILTDELTGANALTRGIYQPVIYNGHVVPAAATIQEWFSCRNWALNPSYATGKLKNIQKLIFKLNPESTFNPFQKMKPITWTNEEPAPPAEGEDPPAPTGQVQSAEAADQHKVYDYDWSGFDYMETPPSTPSIKGSIGEVRTPATELNDHPFEITPDGVTNTNGIKKNPTDTIFIPDWDESVIDESWDMILIRVHGLDRTRLNLHSVANVELMCGEYNTYTPFLSVAYSADEKLERYITNTQKNQKLPFQFVNSYYVE